MQSRVIILAPDGGDAIAGDIADVAAEAAPDATIERNPGTLPDAWDLGVAVFAVLDPGLARAPFVEQIARLHHADHAICPVVRDLDTYDFSAVPSALASLSARNALAIGARADIARLVRFRLGREADHDQQIFLSYRRDDATAQCEAARAALEADGFRVFVDRWRLRGGDPVQREIEAAIRDSGLVLLFESKGATGSRWVREEMLMAQRWRVPIGRLRIDAGAEGFAFVQAPVLDWPGGVDCAVRAFVNGRLARRRLFDEAIARVLRDFAGMVDARVMSTRESGRAGWLLRHPERQILVHADPSWPTLEGWHRLWQSHDAEFGGGRGDSILVTEARELHPSVREAARWAAREVPMDLTTRVGLYPWLEDLWTRPTEEITS